MLNSGFDSGGSTGLWMSCLNRCRSNSQDIPVLTDSGNDSILICFKTPKTLDGLLQARQEYQ
jgi:hypothetical protein